jgi:Flp pilus assembly protein TadD
MQSEWGKAIGEFEVALDKEPNNSEYLRGLGWALHSAGDKAKGLACLHRAVDLAPTNMNILTDLAAAYLSDFQFDKAREYAETAVQIDPSSDLARDVLANIDHFQRKLRRFGKR